MIKSQEARVMLQSVWSVLVTLALVSAAAEVHGQGRQRGRQPFGWRGMRDGLVFLATVPEIQKELGLSAEQRELVDALQADLRDQQRGTFRTRPDAPRRSRGEGPQLGALRQEIEELQRHGEEVLTAILEPDQSQRLRQLRWQHEDLRAFDRDEFIQAMDLSQSQLSTIRQLRQADAQRAASEDSETLVGTQLRARQETLRTEILAQLSNEQKQTWEKMKGPAFEFPDWLSRGGRRGPEGTPGRD
jgi:hypothetical protein